MYTVGTFLEMHVDRGTIFQWDYDAFNKCIWPLISTWLYIFEIKL